MAANRGVTSHEIRDKTLTDLQISDAAAIDEHKLLFDLINGHHHNGIDSRLVSGGGGSTDFRFDTTFIGLINGVNAVFTLPSNFQAGTVAVFTDGLRNKRTVHFNETAPNQVTFISAPLTGTTIVIDYISL
jgi:hypothetical protein